MSISPAVASRSDVLRQMFMSLEVVISCAIWYAAWHANVAVHEMGHYLAALKTNNLRPEIAGPAWERFHRGAKSRWLWYAEMFLKIPYGAFRGVSKENGNFAPSVKAQNLHVSAAGPAASAILCLATLPAGLLMIAAGRLLGERLPGPEGLGEAAVYAGRLLFSVGAVSLLDFLIADSGKYRAFRKRSGEAAVRASQVRGAASRSEGPASDGKRADQAQRDFRSRRLQQVRLPDGTEISAPWQFRNSIMGGRHTEEMGGNLSFQEFMFVPLSAQDYIEAQRITNALQSRVIQILQDSEGLDFVGIGLEGGVVASYARGADDLLPEERALKVAVQAIEECGFVPYQDVCLALDPAASELAKAFRDATGKTDAVGEYLFWRAEEPKVMTTEEMLQMYKRWVRQYPILSIEDPFSEDDPSGWKQMVQDLGERILVIGDDLVTTKDSTIERCAREGLINTALIKANQIGTLSETLLAAKAARDNGLAIVVSHRSKSPNEVMEADIAFALDALGLKCGGGSNTERLIKYGRIVELIDLASKNIAFTRRLDPDLVVVSISAHEEPTNAGVPTVGVVVRLDNGMKFMGATPLGTSAGGDEAVHLVDSIVEECPVTRKHPDLFVHVEREQNFRFAKNVTDGVIAGRGDDELAGLWMRSKRYGGKGCLNAAANVELAIASRFLGRRISELGGLADIDRELLDLEFDMAVKRGKIPRSATPQEKVRVMQRKGNLGMNAILATSLALGRLAAAREGKELPDLLKEAKDKVDRDALYSI